jgi:aminomethyltransferase
MVSFGGWHMPLQYARIAQEHQAVRQAAGLFDVSHMGIWTMQARVGLDDAGLVDVLNTLVPQDLLRLGLDRAVYTQMLNQEAGVVDDVLVYHLDTRTAAATHRQVHPVAQALGTWFVVGNAANRETDAAWMRAALGEDVAVGLASERLGLLALQGRRFMDVLRQAGFGLLDEAPLPPRFGLAVGHVGTVPVVVSRTGYTGEDGVEIFARHDDLPSLWQALLTAGQPLGLLPVGLGARDTLRLEAALPLHGQDLTLGITPLEAGLGWSVAWDKPTPYIGKAALLRQKTQGVAQTACWFKLEENRIPRPHDVLSYQGVPIGEVTSGSLSISLGCPIGMGRIQSYLGFQPGQAVDVGIRGQQCRAHLVKRPFYKAPAA